MCKKQQCFLICSFPYQLPLNSCLCPTALTCIFHLKHVAKLELGYVLSQISLTLICNFKPNILCLLQGTHQANETDLGGGTDLDFQLAICSNNLPLQNPLALICMLMQRPIKLTAFRYGTNLYFPLKACCRPRNGMCAFINLFGFNKLQNFDSQLTHNFDLFSITDLFMNPKVPFSSNSLHLH